MKHWLILLYIILGIHTSLFAQCNLTSLSTDPLEPTMLCEGDTVQVQFSTTGSCSATVEYRITNLITGSVEQGWSALDTFNPHPSDSTCYLLEARCSACPGIILSDSIFVMVTKKPTITGITEICSGTNTMLEAQINGNETVSWWSDSTASATQLSNNGQLTTPILNDTTTFWVRANSTSSVAGGVGKILIAECGLDGASGGTGSEDYIEIANLYNIPVNTSGWVVAISNSYSNINLVNPNLWHLPSSFNPCDIVVKTDVNGSSNYWGSNILWNPPYKGWAMIIDNFGNIVDCAFWGWTAADIASFNATINGYPITIGAEWIGNGMSLPCGSSGGVQFSFARNGSDDHDDNSDFFCQETSVNLLNPGLSCGWTASKSCYFPAKVLVNPTPQLDPINDTIVCGSFTLPAINGTQLTGNEVYYSEQGGNGTQYHPGDIISASMNLYVYDSLETPIGCVDEISFAISITPNTINLDAGPNIEVCEGDQITLTATGAVSYSWNNGVNNGVAFVPPVDTTKYIVTGSDGPCSSKDSLIVLVHPNPQIYAGKDSSICELRTITLSASGGQSYIWDNGVINNIPFEPSVGSTVYHVVGTDIYGCKNTDSLIVTVNPLPNVKFSANILSGCDPLPVTFSNETQGNISTVKWQLSNGDTSSNLNTFTSILHNEGCYDVKLIVQTDKGCFDSLNKQNYVCVFPDPVADFYPDPFDLNTLNPASNMVNTSTGAESYIWNFGDASPSSQDANPTHEFPSNETRPYEITLTAISDNGCMDSITHPVYMKELLLFYIPNAFTPDGDNINDNFRPIFNSGIDPNSYSLYIYNRWGEILFESHNTNIGWDGTYGGKIVPDGIYVWKVIYKLKYNDAYQVSHGTVSLTR